MGKLAALRSRLARWVEWQAVNVLHLPAAMPPRRLALCWGAAASLALAVAYMAPSLPVALIAASIGCGCCFMAWGNATGFIYQ